MAFYRTFDHFDVIFGVLAIIFGDFSWIAFSKKGPPLFHVKN